MDLNKEIQLATDKMIQEKLPTMVEEKVAKMVDGILEDIFRSYSDTAKDIKKKIEEKLDINLQQFDMVDYNTIISKAINDKLVGIVNEGAVEPILAFTKNALGFVREKEIKVSAIHEMVIKTAKEEDYLNKGQGEISFHVERDFEHNWHTISFDTEPGKEMKQCSISFMVSKEGNIFSFKSSDYRNGKGDVTPARMVMLNKLEHQVFRLYSANVKVVVDETDFDNSWYSHYD